MIKVLGISENPIAGAVANLHMILNRYSSKICCRFVQAYPNNGGRVFPHDLLVRDEDKDMIFASFKAADIFHFHNFYQDQALFKRWPELWTIASKKPHVWQVHTQRDCKWVDLDSYAKLKCIAKKLVIAQYHVRQYPECTPVPNMVDIWSTKYAPITMPGENEVPYVIYTPSNVNLKGWDDKGYEATVDVLTTLQRETGIQAKIVYDKPHAEVMRERKFADIGIDQVAVPSYHLCSLENAACGLVNVVNMDDACEKVLLNITGAGQHPFVKATKSTLYYDLQKLVKLPRDKLVEMKHNSRRWMETFWNPKEQIKIYERIYESL